MEVEGSPHSTAGCRGMSRSLRGGQRRAGKPMNFEDLERWIDRLDPSPLIDGVSMLDDI